MSTLDARRRWVVIAALSTILFVSPGCGGDDGDGTDGQAGATSAGPSTTSSVPVTAAVPTTTTPPTTTVRVTTTAGAHSCPANPVPAAATMVTERPRSGDYDGDGHPDGLRLYAVGGTWHLRAEPAGGGGADVEIGPVRPGETVQPLGGADVNSDGADEVFAIVGSGASTNIVGLFVLRSCRLQRVVLNADNATFAVGGSVGHSSALTCQTPNLVYYEAVLVQGSDSSYTGRTTTFRLTGASLIALTSTTATVNWEDPSFARYVTSSCGGLRL